MQSSVQLLQRRDGHQHFDIMPSAGIRASGSPSRRVHGAVVDHRGRRTHYWVGVMAGEGPVASRGEQRILRAGRQTVGVDRAVSVDGRRTQSREVQFGDAAQSCSSASSGGGRGEVFVVNGVVAGREAVVLEIAENIQ